MAEHSSEISTLNTLIATTIDSINGYEDAAGHSEAGRFQQIFRERAGERQRAVEELRAEVRRLGGEPEDSGSFMGKTHQAFFGLKAAITGRDDKAIINEVERGEDYLKEKFESALSSGDLSGESRAVVERCYQSVRSGHDRKRRWSFLMPIRRPGHTLSGLSLCYFSDSSSSKENGVLDLHGCTSCVALARLSTRS